MNAPSLFREWEQEISVALADTDGFGAVRGKDPWTEGKEGPHDLLYKNGMIRQESVVKFHVCSFHILLCEPPSYDTVSLRSLSS
jgi:hypothetical protein